jgi:hypothetical protein
VGHYTITALQTGRDGRCGTIKAFVRSGTV